MLKATPKHERDLLHLGIGTLTQKLLGCLGGLLRRLFGRHAASGGSGGLGLRFGRVRRLAHYLAIPGLRCRRLDLILGRALGAIAANGEHTKCGNHNKC